MALLVAILGTVTALLCAALLLRGYAGGRQRLLLWSGLCFGGLTLANGLLVADMLVDADFHLARLLAGACAMLLLVYGLVWEADGR